jgi:hypothetical protein
MSKCGTHSPLLMPQGQARSPEPRRVSAAQSFKTGGRFPHGSDGTAPLEKGHPSLPFRKARERLVR